MKEKVVIWGDGISLNDSWIEYFDVLRSENIFDINPFPPSVAIWHRLAKLSILILEGIIKNFPMSVATMSQKTKRAYLRLCPEKNDEKIIQEVKGWRKWEFTNLFNPFFP